VDEKQFDSLVRVLGRGRTRRRVFSALAACAGLRLSAATAKPSKAGTVRICHKPGTPAQQTLAIAPAAVAAHLRHGDYRGACCPRGHIFCNGQCCPPPPQGGRATCCPDGSCACAGTCCADACFWDNQGGPVPVVEFCCVPPEHEICPTDEKTETCCKTDASGGPCSCVGAGGVAGSYRRPGR
jgi:hypothetical protein